MDIGIQLVEFANKGDVEGVKRILLGDLEDIADEYWKDAVMAAEGFPEILNLIFPAVSEIIDCDAVVTQLINNCSFDTLKCVAHHLSPPQLEEMFISSIYERDTHLQDWLINHRSFDLRIEMLVACVETQHISLLTRLISSIDASLSHSWPLRCAASDQWHEGVDALWSVSNPVEALALMGNDEGYHIITERLRAEREHALISKAVNNSGVGSVRRKI